MWWRWLRRVWGEMRSLRAMSVEFLPAAKCLRMKLLLGKLLDRGVTGGLIHQVNKLPGNFPGAIEQLRLPPDLGDVARQPHQQPASGSAVVEHDRGHVHPEAGAGAGPYVQIEVRNPAPA